MDSVSIPQLLKLIRLYRYAIKAYLQSSKHQRDEFDSPWTYYYYVGSQLADRQRADGRVASTTFYDEDPNATYPVRCPVSKIPENMVHYHDRVWRQSRHYYFDLEEIVRRTRELPWQDFPDRIVRSDPNELLEWIIGQKKYTIEEAFSLVVEFCNPWTLHNYPQLSEHYGQCRDYIMMSRSHYKVSNDAQLACLSWYLERRPDEKKEYICIDFCGESMRNADESLEWLKPYFHYYSYFSNRDEYEKPERYISSVIQQLVRKIAMHWRNKVLQRKH